MEGLKLQRAGHLAEDQLCAARRPRVHAVQQDGDPRRVWHLLHRAGGSDRRPYAASVQSAVLLPADICGQRRVAPDFTLAQGFPSLNPSQAINPGVTSLDPYVHTPYFQEWNATVQRALPGRMSLEVAYVGMKGVHLESVTDQNQDMAPGPGSVQARRPYPNYGPFASLQMVGNSKFNSLQVKVQKNLSHGLYFLSSFTFGKAMDDL